MKINNRDFSNDNSPPLLHIFINNIIKTSFMKIIISIFLFFVSVSAHCQLDKKAWLTGGSGSFNSYNQTYVSTFSQTAKYSSIDISASVGYFPIDKLAIGLTPTFTSLKIEVTSMGGGTSNGFQLAVGPFIRYYFLDKEKPFNILSEISYQLGINKDISAKVDGKYNRFLAMAGAEVFFNSSVGIEILLGYKTTTQTVDNTQASFSDVHKGFQTSIGFRIHLEKK